MWWRNRLSPIAAPYLAAATGLPGAGAGTSGTISAPDPGAIIARKSALTASPPPPRGDGHLDPAIGQNSSRGATFVDDIAVDDLHPETIVRLARTAPCIDGNAPVSIESRRCHRMAFSACVEGVAFLGRLRLGTGGAGRLAGFAGRVDGAATLNDRGGCLRRYLGCRQRTEGCKHAQDCLHMSTPNRVICGLG